MAKEYSLFAKYHDDIVRPEEWQLDDEFFFLNEIFEDYANWKDILEAACGSWAVMKELVGRGYNVKGFDLSKEMINKAKDAWLENVFVDNMTTFVDNGGYDIVLCNYNSICHLLAFEDWQRFFKCSYDNLKKWGILVFDITTIFEFDSLVEDFTMSKNFWGNTLCLSVNKNNSKYVRDIRIFEKADDWRYDLTRETVSEVSFPIDKVKDGLSKLFKVEKVVDYHYIEPNDESERVYFVARK